MSLSLGFAAEERAKQYLISQGLRFVSANYRCRLGEIDLIMRDGHFVVFVEVKSRRTTAFGGALASVTYQKQQKLIKAAQWYLLKHPLTSNETARFDVVGLHLNANNVLWIKDAFMLN